ncbi:hypothetical protein [Streptomyces sp. col6]|uniref:hypothetical protein n=1 Tax=Streptomyces sp. col6 TaxID=2478958 RepID=UPI001746C244|nr:hypothetical protein [Streptomyces sp. col6]
MQYTVDPSASEDRRVVITDDLGQHVQMSATQFADLVTEAKEGRLETVASA